MLLSEQQLLIILRGLVLLKKQEIPDAKDKIHDLKEGVRFLKGKVCCLEDEVGRLKEEIRCVKDEVPLRDGAVDSYGERGYSVFEGLGT